MSNKKSLLTESEIRRFMKLANIPAVGKEIVKEEVSVGGSQSTDPETSRRLGSGAKNESYDEMEEMGQYEMAEEDMPELEEPSEEEPMAGGGELDLSPQQQEAVMQAVASALGFDIEVSSDSEGAMPADVDAGGAPEEEEEAEEEEEEEAEEEEEEGEQEELQESKLVETVLSRVTARLIAEAKKKKMTAAEKKKKEDEAKKKKEAMKKKAAAAKKKLEEANAPAPKSTMSNASAAGVAKAAGKADKGTFGVTSALRKNDSFENGTSKRGDKLTDVSPSADHIVSHGKKNLATQGGNKKK